MSKRVLILSGSPRKGGNSDLLCDEFLRGAQESGNQAEKVFLRSKKVAPCNACYYCKSSGGKCAISDDMTEILNKMQAADVIVMASPVYFYSIDSQMKAVIDRSVARWTNISYKTLVREARQTMGRLTREMTAGICTDPMIAEKLSALSKALEPIKGKKQYGYLPKQLKSMVDERQVRLL